MTESSILSLLSATATVFIALIFVRAAWHKLSEFTEFTGFVADYKVMPEKLVLPASVAIVAAEVLVVALQFIPGGHMLGLALAAAMLSLYAGVMTINIRRGRTFIECGCGGAVQPLSWSLITRNAVLVLVALSAIVAGPYALDAIGAVIAIISGVAIWTVFLLAEQIIANSSIARATR